MYSHSISLPAPRREEARFAALAVNAGFAGSFGSVYCSHVFANAQTGNIISLASEIHSGEWAGVWSRTAAVGLFILGIYLSIRLPYLWFGGDQRRWKRCCLLIETACFLLQGLLPFEQLSALSPAMYLWPVFFASALQYNTFTALHGVPVSTLFTTNNLRQMTLHATIWRQKCRGLTPASQAEARQERRITLIYIAVFIAFFGGILGGVYLTYLMETRLMFLCAAILFVVWIWQRWDDHHSAG